MDINEFVDHIAEQYDEAENVVWNADTHFKDIDEWSSLTALTIIAMVDEVYEVTLKGEDIRQSTTIKELFDIVASRKA